MSYLLKIFKIPHSAMRNVDNKVSFATAGLVLTAIVFSAASANAVSLTIPTTTVNGFDVAVGPSFTVTSNFLPTDTISINASGTVNINKGGIGYTANAAGIATQSSVLYGTPVAAGNVYGITNDLGYGTLLIGNNSLGFYKLFPFSNVTGLGSSNPPTNLSLVDAPLSSIFGSDLTNGTVLEFRTADVNYGSQSGAFTVSGSINQTTTAVPEPFTIIGTLIGGTAAVRMRKKLKAEKA